jgi:hypothetical protein
MRSILDLSNAPVDLDKTPASRSASSPPTSPRTSRCGLACSGPRGPRELQALAAVQTTYSNARIAPTHFEFTSFALRRMRRASAASKLS